MEAILMPILTKWATESNPIKFGESLVLLFIAFMIMRPFLKKQFDQFKSHFEQVEKRLTDLSDGLKDLNKSLTKLEEKHDDSISDLKWRVEKLEKKNTN